MIPLEMRLLPLLLAMVPSALLAADLRIDVVARDLVPGDLVRVDVSSDVPLAAVRGTFRGEALDFVRSCEGDGPCGTWSAWEALDLDWEPGPIELKAEATTASGSKASSARTIELKAKVFPTSELKVEGKYVEPSKAQQARIERDNAKLGKVYARRTEEAPPGSWLRPVPGEPTGVFGSRRVFNGQKRKPHAGLDLRAATGTPVQSSGGGVVALAEDLYFSGNTVIVDHGGGMFLLYAHLSRIDVTPGERVEAGTQVGLSGATGRVTGPHLHWGGKVGQRIFDPTSLLDPAFAAPAK
jgi:murein DD-endopeptidase MepM/ murein hydrolase activator NlpD